MNPSRRAAKVERPELFACAKRYATLASIALSTSQTSVLRLVYRRVGKFPYHLNMTRCSRFRQQNTVE
jgi:hypothetical protein